MTVEIPGVRSTVGSHTDNKAELLAPSEASRWRSAKSIFWD